MSGLIDKSAVVEAIELALDAHLTLFKEECVVNRRGSFKAGQELGCFHKRLTAPIRETVGRIKEMPELDTEALVGTIVEVLERSRVVETGQEQPVRGSSLTGLIRGTVKLDNPVTPGKMIASDIPPAGHYVWPRGTPKPLESVADVVEVIDDLVKDCEAQGGDLGSHVADFTLEQLKMLTDAIRQTSALLPDEPKHWPETGPTPGPPDSQGSEDGDHG